MDVSERERRIESKPLNIYFSSRMSFNKLKFLMAAALNGQLNPRSETLIRLVMVSMGSGQST